MATIPRFYLISDRRRMGCDPLASVALLARAGLPAFQWREKDLSASDLHLCLSSLAAAIRDLGARTRLLVNDRVDVALAAGVGVHLPEGALPTRIVRAMLPDGALIFRSTHSLAAAQRARNEGADAVTFGPVYDTPSKRPFGPPVGVGALREVCAALPGFPVLALGGVTLERVSECLCVGAHGVSVIGAVWDAEDPVAATGEFLAACRM